MDVMDVKNALRSISTGRLTQRSGNAKTQSHCLFETKVQCRTPPLMLMQIRLLRKEGISHQIAPLLAPSKECRTDAHQECIHDRVMCIPCSQRHCSRISVLRPFLIHHSITVPLLMKEEGLCSEA